MSDVGIGSVLHEARIKAGRGISEAAAATSMRVVQIEAIEEDRFEIFGGDVYAKGFIKSYAQFLGVDHEPLLVIYRRVIQHDHMDPLALTAGPIRSERSSDVPAWLLRGVAVIGVVAMVIGGFTLVQSRTPDPAIDDEQPVAAPAPADRPSESERPGAGQPQVAEPEPEPTFEGIVLTLAFEDASWVSITVDGQTRQEGLFAKGEVVELQGDDEVIIRLGNAGGVRALFNGSGVGPFGGAGEVREIRFTPHGYDEV